MRRPLLLLLLLLAQAAPSAAHRLAPSFLSLREGAGSQVAMLWKTPRVVARGTRLRPILPESCTLQGEPRMEAQATAFVQRAQLHCPGGLAGAWIGAEGLRKSGTDILLLVTLRDGSERRTILSRDTPRWRVSAAERPLAVARSYALLGMRHLIGGLDHVLFVAGLIFLVRGRRRLLGAITAFTGGHSVTLALASLGWLQLPQGVADVGIAASLVVLAAELVRVQHIQQDSPSGLARRPWLMSAGFGLLHGLGFASALNALGLPRQAIPLALFSFNVGVEIGQLALIVGLLPLAALLFRTRHAPRWLLGLPANAIGSLGVFWCLERAGRWLGLL